MGGVIHVEVGELVLRGFPALDEQRFAESVALELAALLSEAHAPVTEDVVSHQVAAALIEAASGA